MNYHLLTFDPYAQFALHHVSKHNPILRTKQFIDARCKKLGDLYFFQILYCNLHYYKRLGPKL